MPKQTVCLVCILRNEAEFIGNLIDSVAGYVDYAIFLDSESTDDSVFIIKTLMSGQGIPFEVVNYTKQFRGDTKRTDAIDLARDKADYILVLDADNTIKFEMIPEYAFDGLTEDAYYMTKRQGSIHYPLLSLFKGSIAWQFTGIIHDFPHRKDGGEFSMVMFPTGVIITEPIKESGPRMKGPKNYYNDALTIERELHDHGQELSAMLIHRYTFYLAQSYRDCNMISRSIDAYTARVQLGGWDEEIFYSLLSIARLKQLLGLPVDEVIIAAMEAWNYRPQRLEAAYLLMQLYIGKNLQYVAYAIGTACSGLKCTDKLFLEQETYTTHFPALMSELSEKYKYLVNQ